MDSQGSIAVNKQVSEEAIGGNQSCSCGVHVTDIIIRIPIFEKKIILVSIFLCEKKYFVLWSFIVSSPNATVVHAHLIKQEQSSIEHQ